MGLIPSKMTKESKHSKVSTHFGGRSEFFESNTVSHPAGVYFTLVWYPLPGTRCLVSVDWLVPVRVSRGAYEPPSVRQEPQALHVISA